MFKRIGVAAVLAADTAGDWVRQTNVLGLRGPAEALRKSSLTSPLRTKVHRIRAGRRYRSLQRRMVERAVSRDQDLGGVVTGLPDGVNIAGMVAASEAFELLLAGGSLESALARYIRSGHGYARIRNATAIGYQLYEAERYRELGAAILGYVTQRQDTPQAATTYFADSTPAIAAAIAPMEYTRIALIDSPDRFDRNELLEALLEAGEGSADEWMAVIGTFASVEDFAAVDALVAHVAAGIDEFDEEAQEKLRFTFQWMKRVENPDPVPAVREGALSIAVMDYGNPRWEKCSSNVGDFTQTVAAMGHLVRFEGIDFGGDPEAVEVAHLLRSRVRPEFTLETDPVKVDLVRIDRDASSYNGIPDDTWLIAFGWHMLPQYGDKLDFPYTTAIKPLFISFHCNNRDMMTEETVAYLRENSPVGCRDWYTYDLLQQLDVPAFFSGCLTTTLDTYWNPAHKVEGARGALYVDVKAPKHAREISQADPQVRFDSFRTNMVRSVEMLDMYKATADTIFTSRLHSYLPARTIGLNAEFVPKNPADLRYEGLITADAAGLQEIRDGIREVLVPTVRAILEGKDDATVRAEWAKATAPFVERSRAIRSAPSPVPPSTVNTAEVAATVRSRRIDVAATTPRTGETIDVCFGFDQNYVRQFYVVLTALLARTDRPVRVWAISRGITRQIRDDASRAFPEVDFVWLSFDGIDYGHVTRMIPHISVVTMDRLMLPEVVDIDRIIYLDLDLLPLEDVAPLADIDLGDSPLAARSSIITGIRSGFRVIDSVARATRKPEAAALLRKLMLARHPSDFVAFNAGVLVLDLARMREDDFCVEFVPYVEHFGMHDQDVLNCYAGAARVALEPRWNSVPTQEVLPEPSIVHWAGAVKPWAGTQLPFRDRWIEAQDAAAARCAEARVAVFSDPDEGDFEATEARGD